jgi:exosortase/archaeosortase family protein
VGKRKRALRRERRRAEQATPLASRGEASHLVPRWTAIQEWYDGKGPVVQFGLKFGILMAAFYAISFVPWWDQALYGYLVANAWLSNLILNVLGVDSTTSEVSIRSSQFAVNIRRGCDAVEPSWLFASALLAFPAPLLRKIPGILVGVAALLALNLVRIVSLFLIGIYFPSLFKPAHLEIWPTAFIIAAVLLWWAWIQWATPKESIPRDVSA